MVAARSRASSDEDMIHAQAQDNAVPIFNLVRASLCWGTYVVLISAVGVETEMYDAQFEDRTLTIEVVMIWAYVFQLIGNLCWNFAFFCHRSNEDLKTITKAFGWNSGDWWKHVVCGVCGAFDISSYVLAIDQGGALLCSIVRLCGCMLLTVILLKLVAGRDIDSLQKIILLPTLTAAIAASLADAETSSGSGDSQNVGMGLALVSVSIVTNSFMCTFMEFAFATKGPMCFPLRQTADTVGTLVPIVIFKFVRAGLGQVSYSVMMESRQGAILAGTIALWNILVMITVKFCGADMYALGKIAAVVLTFLANVIVFGKHFSLMNMFIIMTLMALCLLYVMTPAFAQTGKPIDVTVLDDIHRRFSSGHSSKATENAIEVHRSRRSLSKATEKAIGRDAVTKPELDSQDVPPIDVGVFNCSL